MTPCEYEPTQEDLTRAITDALDRRHHLNTADLAAHLAAALAPVIEVRALEARADAWDEGYGAGIPRFNPYRARAGTVTPPPCDNHRETQHRDKRPPWCETCGWNHGRPAIQPFQVTKRYGLRSADA